MNHMTIDDTNFESFLMLLIDNELTAEERVAVEAYVTTNPAAKATLEVLKESILPAENHITFNQKHLLHKKANGITLGNYEAYFLLYADNELTPPEKEQVEHFVLTHPPLQIIFEQIMSSKLTPATIVFEGKEALYRNQQRRVYPIYFVRLAAAAVLFGVMVLLYLLVPGTNNSRQPIATNTSSNAAAQKVNATTKTSTTGSNLANTNSNTNPILPPANNILPKQPTNVAYAASTNKPLVNKKQPMQQSSINNNVAVEVKENNMQQFANTTALPITSQGALQTITVSEEVAQPAATVTIAKESDAAQQPTNALVSHAVYKVLDTQAEDDNSMLLLGSAQINKTKLKGLLRKASSLFERKNERSDKEKTIKIASFEL